MLKVKNTSKETVENFAGGKLFILKPGQCFEMPERYALKLTRNNPKQLAIVKDEPAIPSPEALQEIVEVKETNEDVPLAEQDSEAHLQRRGRPRNK